MGHWSELSSWLMPTGAVTEWLTLSALLDELDDSDVPCRADPAAWWPDRKYLNSPTTNAAVMACEGCPARDACLAYALAADEREGVWGGLLPDERRKFALPKAA
ncbi:MAG: Transcription factor WhiB [Frankiales bacterium]|nr:Transcription factor WhiB [Frankiales bacterium]